MAEPHLDPLGAFLTEAEGKRFQDGTHDCLLMPADWVIACGRPDPAAPFRGQYDTPLGRQRILRREGGMLAVMRAGAERSSLIETANPVRGDVGLILIPAGLEVGAIALGDGLWASVAGCGVFGAVAQAICAWRV